LAFQIVVVESIGDFLLDIFVSVVHRRAAFERLVGSDRMERTGHSLTVADRERIMPSALAAKVIDRRAESNLWRIVCNHSLTPKKIPWEQQP
jgi:hypothetical protein